MTIKIVYATASAMINGFHIRQGSYWPANDPLVVANPSFFSDDPRQGELSTSAPLVGGDIVEQATAGPGERRGQVKRG